MVWWARGGRQNVTQIRHGANVVFHLNEKLHWENVVSMGWNHIIGLSYWPNLVAIWLIEIHFGKALDQDDFNLVRPCCHHVGPFSNKPHGTKMKMTYRAHRVPLTLVAIGFLCSSFNEKTL